MNIAISSDLTGCAFKDSLEVEMPKYANLTYLKGIGGYPDIAHNLAKRIASGEYDRGILICRTGQGMAMMANKVKGIYAGVCSDVASARKIAASNDAQILCLGSDVVSLSTAKLIIQAFLETPFEKRPNAERMRELENL